MQDLKNDEDRQAMRESYGKTAKTGAAGCVCDCGCGLEDNPKAEDAVAAVSKTVNPLPD